MSDRPAIWLVGAVRFRPHKRVTGLLRADAHTWAWYPTREEAEARMRRDSLFFEDGWYTHGLVERYRLGDCLADEEHWFVGAWDAAAKANIVNACPKPAAVARVVSFLL